MDDDILTLLVRFVGSMRRLGLEPPDAVILKSNKDGMRLLGELMQRAQFNFIAGQWGKPIEHPDGSVWMEIEVYGLKIRWPATKYARSGGYKWQ